jgi:hypothetical protein
LRLQFDNFQNDQQPPPWSFHHSRFCAPILLLSRNTNLSLGEHFTAFIYFSVISIAISLFSISHNKKIEFIAFSLVFQKISFSWTNLKFF